MSDYRLWCRLCGDLDGSSEISSNVLQIIDQMMELPTEALKICDGCNAQLTQFDNLQRLAKSLERLFSGLMEESDADLTMDRLNAYRDHFRLDGKIVENSEVLELDSEFEYIEESETRSIEEDSESRNLIAYEDEAMIQEDYGVVEEIYLEPVEAIEGDESMEDEVPCEPQKCSHNPRKKLQKSNSLEKSEDEKLFTFQCHICPQLEFINMKLLSLHCKSTHNCLPLVKCCSESCNASLSTWRRLLIHKEKHFPSDDKFRCNECSRFYVSATALAKHIESHNFRFICSHCGKDFKEAKTLKFHEATHEKPIEARRNHICRQPDCDIKFITKQAMENHYKVKHERIVSFVCSEAGCEKAFFTKKSLYEHMRSHANIRNYHCNICNFKAKTSSALNIHQDVHKVGDAFSCDICSAAFPVLRRLKAHMVSHSENTPFNCSYCESAFKRKKDLKDHENIHTKERPFVCMFCMKSFANAANCRKHKVKDHATELKLWEAENGISGRKKLECYHK